MRKLFLMPAGTDRVVVDVLDYDQLIKATKEELKAAYRRWEWLHEYGPRTRRGEFRSKMNIVLNEFRCRKGVRE